MIIINLLPENLRPIKRTPLPYMASGLIFLLAVAAVGYMFVTAQGAQAQVERQIASLKEELNGYGDVVDKFNALEEEKTRLAERIDVIKEIVKDRIVWSEQLALLGDLVPSNIWLTGIEIQRETIRERRSVTDPKSGEEKVVMVTLKPLVMEVEGYIVPDEDGNMRLSPFAAACESHPKFSKMFKVQDQKWTAATLEGQDVTKFILTFEINEGGDEEDEDKEEAKS